MIHAWHLSRFSTIRIERGNYCAYMLLVSFHPTRLSYFQRRLEISFEVLSLSYCNRDRIARFLYYVTTRKIFPHWNDASEKTAEHRFTVYFEKNLSTIENVSVTSANVGVGICFANYEHVCVRRHFSQGSQFLLSTFFLSDTHLSSLRVTTRRWYVHTVATWRRNLTIPCINFSSISTNILALTLAVRLGRAAPRPDEARTRY